MSTAILMAMGAEQSSKQPVAHDVEQLEGPTFAQALDVRMGGTPAGLEKAPATAPQNELLNAHTEVVTKSMANTPELTIGAKAKVLASQSTPPPNGSKGVDIEKTALVGTAEMASPKVQAKTDIETLAAALPVNEGKDAVQTGTVSKVASATNSHNENLKAQEDLESKDQIQMLSIQTQGAQKEIAVTGGAEGAAPVKKTVAKTKEGAAGQAVAAAKNGAAATAHLMADEIKPAQGVVVQIPVPMTGQVVAAVAPVVPTASSDIAYVNAKNGAGFGSVSVTGASFAGKSTIAGSVDSTSSVHAVKAPGADAKTESAAPGDQVAPTKSDAKADRVQQTATNEGSDTDIKARTAGEPAAVVVHAQVTGADIAAPAATPLAAGLAKLPAGEGGAHTTGSPNFLNEPDSSGGVARSMEPMPRTLSATPSALEVGIPDGTHGWLKVRAEMADGGVVNASVSAASAASQEMLHRELPSLTAYLQSEKVAVNAVVVHSAAGVGAEPRGYLAGSESGGAGQTPQQSNEGGQQRNSADAAAEDVVEYEGLQGVVEDGTLPLASFSSGGSWLSVRA